MANTGNVIATMRDVNPLSPTYDTTRITTYYDAEKCPGGTTPIWVEVSRTCEQSDSGSSTRNFYCQLWTLYDNKITYRQIDCDGGSVILNYNCTYKIITGDCATSVDDNAFNSQSTLTYVDLGRTITSIGTMAFSECRNLNTVIVRNTVPPTFGTNAFYEPSSSLLIFVPDESVNAYKTADGWSSLADRIYPLSNM